jgi:protocatechuate 3,4-dioxygenase beta subunit
MGRKSRNKKRQSTRWAWGPLIEPMEARQLLSASVAPSDAMSITENSIALKAVKYRSAQVVKGVVGVTSSDSVYSVSVTAEVNLGLTLEHLLQSDKVYIDYADGTQVNSGWQSSKGTLSISQHLDAGSYLIDINHGFVADNTSSSQVAPSGAAKVITKAVKKYHIAITDAYILVVRGLKHDDTIAPTEPAKATDFSAAFGASGAQSEPTVSSTLVTQSGYVGYQAFTAAEGYVLWGANGPQPTDEIQQYLGDCYFMSVISSIARDDPGLIEQDIVPQSDGTYVVKFQNNGTEVDEQVDDMFPVNAQGQTVFAGIDSTTHALWPAILEKAWCYFRPDSTAPDSYDGIQSGRPSESLMAFGSPNAVDVPASNYNTAPSLLTAISTQLQAGDLVDVGTEDPQGAKDPLPSGLFVGHAYSVVTVDVAQNSIELRNPWNTNTSGVMNDGSMGYITITGDQLIQSIEDFSYGTLTAVKPNPNPTPTPTPTPTPSPTNTTTTQTISENLGPDSYQNANGSNYDFFTFTANTAGTTVITITTSVFTPQLLIAQDGTGGWTSVGSDPNNGGKTTASVTFTAATGITYGIGVFSGSSTDAGVYTLTLQGDLSTPVQSTPSGSTGSLSGTVYDDANDNLVQDNGETGLSGVTVFLDLNGTGTFQAGDPTATTDANGDYTFTGLAAGAYTVYVEQPAGDSQTSPANNAGVTGTVTAGQDTTLASIGEAVSEQGGGTISGKVFVDENNDGTLDSGDPGLAGWYVYIDLAGTGEYAPGDPYAQTDAYGNYSFSGLAPGSYSVYVYPTDGYTTTLGSAGYSASVTATQSSVNANFGETQGTQGGSTSITGTVYDDLNNDGANDSGDPGLAGWTVYVDVNGSGSYTSGDPTATTDSTGTYTFTNLPAGTYTIGIVPQAGYSTTQGSSEWVVTTVAGQTSNGGSFGESAATGSVEGTVYNAANDYGVYNWEVDAYDSNGNLAGSYVTGTDGGYYISGLAPGTYTIYAVVYNNLPWRATQGADGYTVTVQADQTAFGGDFGERYL